jgi:hypothetical protein
MLLYISRYNFIRILSELTRWRRKHACGQTNTSVVLHTFNTNIPWKENTNSEDFFWEVAQCTQEVTNVLENLLPPPKLHSLTSRTVAIFTVADAWISYLPVIINETSSVAWIRERTIPTERPPLVGEVSAKVLQIEVATLSAWRIPTAVFLVFRPESLLFLPSCTHEAEWTPFQTHYFSENLVVPGIEPGTFGSVARNSDR